MNKRRYISISKVCLQMAENLVFYETLRMFPPAGNIPKVAAEDTTLVTHNSAGEPVIVPVPQGTYLTLHLVGMHYHPLYWNDPAMFQPARFLAPDFPRDAFLPFSGGARACLGRRFFETEGIAILTMLISKFKIEVKNEAEFAGESFEEKKARIFQSREGLTMTFVVCSYYMNMVSLNTGPSGLCTSLWSSKDVNSATQVLLIVVAIGLWVSIKQITAHRAKFPKPVEEYTALSFFGRNIVASEGEEWKRYRKVTAPAFSEPNNKLVWDETVRIMNGLFDDVWAGKDTIIVDHAVEITLPIALFVIGAAGFGRRISWEDDLIIPAGHKMTFKDSLHHASMDIPFKASFPDWFLQYAPSKRLNRCKAAYDELDMFMTEMVQARRNAEKKEERYDLFSSLLDASEGEQDGGAILTDRELLGSWACYDFVRRVLMCS
ncbi:hypothetical protein PHLCEN_2v13703 [Hermanssonia centrifuga]|uniref:Cytochrome P450 n=1 Tax=Hermanssonia centrifuga TaxID=98765 RepID=A0A2R6NEI4_9APHY|nr:hypothetical protein PHLCEN_2v13703 [Hermanssonia centrifuga]